MIHDPLQLRPPLGSKISIPPIAPMLIPKRMPPKHSRPEPHPEPHPEPCTMGRGRRGDFSIDKRGARGWGALVQ